MKLIFLYGLPATGKLTVARELAVITGYKVFHNHLVVDMLLSMFEFASQPFVELREEMWLSVFAQAARAQTPGLIFTFAPEATVRPTFIPAVLKTLAENGGSVEFFELTCPFPELKRRIVDPSRLKYGKLASVEQFEQLQAEGALGALEMPAARLSVDTSIVTPARAALQIARSLELPGLA
jgi:AAA domain